MHESSFDEKTIETAVEMVYYGKTQEIARQKCHEAAAEIVQQKGVYHE